MGSHKQMALDLTKKYIYWVDDNIQLLRRVDYDGKNSKSFFYQIPILSNLLYLKYEQRYVINNVLYIQTNQKHTYELDLLLGRLTPVSTWLDGKVTFVATADWQPEKSHPCQTNNGGCDHICIPIWQDDATGFVKCSCSFGYDLINETKCQPTETVQFLMFYDRYHLQLDTLLLSPQHDSNYRVITPIYYQNRNFMQQLITIDPINKIYYIKDNM